MHQQNACNYKGDLRQGTVATAGHEGLAVAEEAGEGVLGHHLGDAFKTFEGVIVFEDDHPIVGSIVQGERVGVGDDDGEDKDEETEFCGFQGQWFWGLAKFLDAGGAEHFHAVVAHDGDGRAGPHLFFQHLAGGVGESLDDFPSKPLDFCFLHNTSGFGYKFRYQKFLGVCLWSWPSPAWVPRWRC